MARMLMRAPEGGRGSEPLTPIYPFNQPGEAIELYSGPIGRLYDEKRLPALPPAGGGERRRRRSPGYGTG
jgi:hypothetical protein